MRKKFINPPNVWEMEVKWENVLITDTVDDTWEFNKALMMPCPTHDGACVALSTSFLSAKFSFIATRAVCCAHKSRIFNPLWAACVDLFMSGNYEFFIRPPPAFDDRRAFQSSTILGTKQTAKYFVINSVGEIPTISIKSISSGSRM